MWYEVPKAKTEEKLAPIFPWEEREMPKPTRVFVEDEPIPKPPEAASEPEFAGADEFEVQSEEKIKPSTPIIRIGDEATWAAFGTTTRNAWDEMPSIENYVRALTAHQKNRNKPLALQNPISPSATHQEQMRILSPTNEPDPDQLIEQVQRRRESLILTDFPTASERPSLPVTPAPKPRSSFWGSDRNEEAEMPPADGVPNQEDWVSLCCGLLA